MMSLLHRVARGVPLPLPPVALPERDQRPVNVELATGRGRVDVSTRHFVLSLKPLVIGVAGCESLFANGSREEPARLEIGDPRLPRGAVGTIDASTDGVAQLGGLQLTRLRARGAVNLAASWSRRRWRYFLAWRHTRRGARTPYNVQMTALDLRALDVLYAVPKPVFLVSVGQGPTENLFPMDLVGSVEGGPFLLALRTTSPSVATIREQRRVAFASIPATLREITYDLGTHHELGSVDWSTLPFDARESELWGLPVPEPAFRVRELEIENDIEIGSHVVFAATVRSDVATDSDVPQLCHTSGLYLEARARAGVPFETA